MLAEAGVFGELTLYSTFWADVRDWPARILHLLSPNTQVWHMPSHLSWSLGSSGWDRGSTHSSQFLSYGKGYPFRTAQWLCNLALRMSTMDAFVVTCQISGFWRWKVQKKVQDGKDSIFGFFTCILLKKWFISPQKRSFWESKLHELVELSFSVGSVALPRWFALLFPGDFLLLFCHRLGLLGAFALSGGLRLALGRVAGAEIRNVTSGLVYGSWSWFLSTQTLYL